MPRRPVLVAVVALALALAPASMARAVTLDVLDLADDVCLLPQPGSTVCLEIEGRVVPDLHHPWRTTVVAYARMCAQDGGGEVACSYTTDEWGYVAGAGGACVTVAGLPRPAACANGRDECVLVVLGANRVICD
jgi:hypothetical protein